ncbi:unnamed protein product [Closterium sp. Naga37s-1]|nr:unnamed protein product [Closterium sp. Naga37s-1]
MEEEGGSGGGGVIQVSFTDMHDFKTLVSLQDAIVLNQVEKRAQERSRVWWSHEANRGPHWFHVEDGTQAARTHAAIATNPSLHTPASRSLPHSHTHSISHPHSHTHSHSLPHSQPHSRSHSLSVSSLSNCLSEASSRDSSCHGPVHLSASSSASSLPCPATPATSGAATATAAAATPTAAVAIPSATSGPPLSAVRALISSSSAAADLDASSPPCAASPPLGCCIAASASSPLLSFSLTNHADSTTPSPSPSPSSSLSASASTPASSLQPRTSSGSSPSPYRPSASPLRTRPHASSVPSRHSASPLRSSRHSASPLRSRHSASPLRSRPSSSSTSASSRPSSSASSTTPSLTSIAFGSGAVSSATLKRLIRKGIPPHLRARVWKAVSGAGRKQAVAPVDYYQWLVEQTTGKETDHTLQIDNDLHRTFPGHPRMDTAEGLAALRRVLVAYSFRDTHVGYCQGMNYVAAYLLLVMRSEEDAFWMLATLVENVLYDDCFAEDLFGVHVEQRVLKDLLHRKQPKLAAHLDAIYFEPSLVTTEWFLCVFAKSFPSETTLRVWDVLFNEGAKVLFRVALALFKMNEAELYQAAHVGEAVEVLVRSTAQQYDPEVLLQVEVLVRSTAQQYDPEVLLQVSELTPAPCVCLQHEYMAVEVLVRSTAQQYDPEVLLQVAFDRLGSMSMATIARQRTLPSFSTPLPHPLHSSPSLSTPLRPHQVAFDRLGSMSMATIARQRTLPSFSTPLPHPLHSSPSLSTPLRPHQVAFDRLGSMSMATIAKQRRRQKVTVIAALELRQQRVASYTSTLQEEEEEDEQQQSMRISSASAVDLCSHSPPRPRTALVHSQTQAGVAGPKSFRSMSHSTHQHQQQQQQQIRSLGKLRAVAVTASMHVSAAMAAVAEKASVRRHLKKYQQRQRPAERELTRTASL